MMNLWLTILVACFFAALAWWISRLSVDVFDTKYRLKRRLSETWVPGAARRVNSDEGRISLLLARCPGLGSVQKSLRQYWPQLSLARFLLVCIGAAVAAAMVTFAVISSFIFAAIAGVVAGASPLFILSARRSRRRRLLADQLPEALDFLSRILKAGHSFTTGLQMMGNELPAPLADEFQRAYDQHSLGQSVEQSLKDMAERVGSRELAMFVTAVLIQRQTGGDLSEVLSNIAGMIRARIRLAQQVKAKTAEGRFTGYILVAFPAAMFVVMNALNPDYCRIMFDSRAGLMMLGVAVSLEILGLLAIRKVVTIRV